MLKFVVIIVGVFLLFKFFKGDAKKKAMQEQQSQEQMQATGDMVKDPVCGSFVSIDGDIRVRDEEGVHHFCSYDCRDKYLKQIEAKNED